ncbi:hypothetical protein PMAYCL1PPCAC_15858 [Pristionchus mayeri]|uniref:Uncharacterized protein n=1 Tax=Pristionchus mayeri TaxID=1317129 RepID=A0AAN5CJM4_9BILA|nr:hypothetical protein PMAYCL1PPCAC_15858 [Pristionchus mayeri]
MTTTASSDYTFCVLLSLELIRLGDSTDLSTAFFRAASKAAKGVLAVIDASGSGELQAERLQLARQEANHLVNLTRILTSGSAPEEVTRDIKNQS